MLFSSNSRYKVTRGGRGSGKSIGYGIGVIKYAIEHPNSTILCVRGTQVRISASSLQILKDVIYYMGVESLFEITEHTLTCINGTKFIFMGARNYQEFKSIQGIDLCWVDEATELSAEAWEFLIPTVRSEESEIWICFNPERESDWVYQQFVLNDRHDAISIQLNYWDNRHFPEVLRKEMEWDKEHDYLKYLHIWEGKLIQKKEGAHWSKSMIKYINRDEYSQIINTNYGVFDKIIVAIDPSVGDKIKQDECGIVVVGKSDDSYVVLEDASAIMSPEQWSNKAVALYHKYSADYIVAEGNQGQALINSVIRQVDRNIKVVRVNATRGKYLRAEPIVLLYETDKVKHLKNFKELEYEMITYTGDPKEASPDRLDALVWALTNLAQVNKAPAGMTKANISQLNQRKGTARLLPKT